MMGVYASSRVLASTAWGRTRVDGGRSQYPVSPPDSVRARRLLETSAWLVSYMPLANFRKLEPRPRERGYTSLPACEYH